MRLIDADALEEAMWPFERIGWEKGWNDALSVVMKNAPTVDAVPVVRCKDCKWWNDYEESCFGKLARADDYCAWGERKEDGE